MSQYDDLEDEEELRESYPHLYGGNETPYEPPGYQLTPEQEKFRETERAKWLARFAVVEKHGEDYHNIDEFTEEMLSDLNFRTYDNLFLARPASAFLRSDDETGRKKRHSSRLFSDLWHEGELCVLFGDTGCGKSLLAMQIAWALTGGPQFSPFEMDVEPGLVLYFDFELSKEQFRKRYTPDDPEAPRLDEPFPNTLIRCPPQYLDDLPPGFDSFHRFLVHSIRSLVDKGKAKAVVIDNITWLSSNIESSPAALRLMKTLVYLKDQLGISILVLAHTPKRFTRTPITVAHLHGSKMLSNFADSIFAIGTSRRAKDIRYIKAIKQRSSAAREASTEVATVRIRKDDWFLGFEFEGFCDERAHLGWSYGTALEAEFAQHVERLVERGLTQREMAEELGVSPATVNRCLRARMKQETLVSL